MRVIAGTAKGHNLVTPKGLDTRPTTDKVRGSLFSMLMGSIAGSTVLDLFAGSGALGIEALSRGAEKCIFADFSEESVLCIQKNLEHTKLSDRAEVKKTDSLSFLKTTDKRFDLIFLDPPYHRDLAKTALAIIKERGLLSSGGYVSVETDEGELDISEISGFTAVKDKKYGRIVLRIFEAE